MGANDPVGRFDMADEARMEELLSIDAQKVNALAGKKAELTALANKKAALMALAEKKDELLALLSKK